jgi:hypothetical protein
VLKNAGVMCDPPRNAKDDRVEAGVSVRVYRLPQQPLPPCPYCDQKVSAKALMATWTKSAIGRINVRWFIPLSFYGASVPLSGAKTVALFTGIIKTVYRQSS